MSFSSLSFRLADEATLLKIAKYYNFLQVLFFFHSDYIFNRFTFYLIFFLDQFKGLSSRKHFFFPFG